MKENQLAKHNYMFKNFFIKFKQEFSRNLLNQICLFYIILDELLFSLFSHPHTQ